MVRKTLASLIDEALDKRLWRQLPPKVRRIVEKLCQWLESLDKELTKLRQQYERLATKLAELRQQYERLATKLAELRQQYERLTEENADLREQLNSNSSNSSKPPSSDRGKKRGGKKRDGAPRRPARKGSGRQRGGQPGHPEHPRQLFPPERTDEQVDCEAESCEHCGSDNLRHSDEAPERHQVVELPEIRLWITDYLLYLFKCEDCGGLTRARLPEGVAAVGYGPRLTALVGVLGGLYQISYRMTQELLQDLLGLRVSLGEIGKLRARVSEALAPAVDQARNYIRNAELVHADETSYRQGNADGRNPEARQGWLWLFATSTIAYFEIALSRSKATAQKILGEGFRGMLVSDRYEGYNWISVYLHQFCWAHLTRNFQKLAERDGESGKIGHALLALKDDLFHHWCRVRDGTICYSTFQRYASTIRVAMRELLESAAGYIPGKGEKSERAKTARTCQKLLESEPALWLIARRRGICWTNNHGERLLRRGVLWRRTSFGTQSQWGSVFVSRMLTVVETLKLQKRGVLKYITAACEAARKGQGYPPLLP